MVVISATDGLPVVVVLTPGTMMPKAGAVHSINFKARMRSVLAEVRAQYADARFELTPRGMLLHHSPPPIRPRMVTVSKPQDAASEAPGETSSGPSGGPSGDASAVDDGGHEGELFT
jgi:hypothetical protein